MRIWKRQTCDGWHGGVGCKSDWLGRGRWVTADVTVVNWHCYTSEDNLKVTSALDLLNRTRSLSEWFIERPRFRNQNQYECRISLIRLLLVMSIRLSVVEDKVRKLRILFFPSFILAHGVVTSTWRCVVHCQAMSAEMKRQCAVHC